MEYITFDDIEAATTKNLTLKTMKGKAVKIRALDPIFLMDMMKEVQALQESAKDAEGSKKLFITARDLVVRGCVTPAFTAETVTKVPAGPLLEIFNGIVEFSGAGDEVQEEAQSFPEAAPGADGSATVG